MGILKTRNSSHLVILIQELKRQGDEMKHITTFQITIKTKKPLTNAQRLELRNDMSWRLQDFQAEPLPFMTGAKIELKYIKPEPKRSRRRKK